MPSTAEQLDLEGHDLIARGHAKLAEAARRATQTTPPGDWIRVDALPVPKRSALAAARTRSLRAIKQGRVWLTTRGDAAAWLASAKPASVANDADDDVRAALGLTTRRTS